MCLFCVVGRSLPKYFSPWWLLRCSVSCRAELSSLLGTSTTVDKLAVVTDIFSSRASFSKLLIQPNARRAPRIA